MLVKLNNAASSGKMKKQAPKNVAHRIDAYLVQNNITVTKLRAEQTLPYGDIAIQTTNEEVAKKLRGEEGWTKMLGSKAKLARKQYGIVALGIPIEKIEIEKPEETKEKIITQNASICSGIKIGSIFWLFKSKKEKRTSSLVVELADAKMVNMLIEEGLVLDHTLHGCMRYNPACRIKQCFNCIIITVTSRFTARKEQSAELVQAPTKLPGAPETKGRNARYIMVHKHCGINGVSIERKMTLE